MVCTATPARWATTVIGVAKYPLARNSASAARRILPRVWSARSRRLRDGGLTDGMPAAHTTSQALVTTTSGTLQKGRYLDVRRSGPVGHGPVAQRSAGPRVDRADRPGGTRKRR